VPKWSPILAIGKLLSSLGLLRLVLVGVQVQSSTELLN